MSNDNTDRILNPGKFTSAEPCKEIALNQARQRVIEAAKSHTESVQNPSGPIDSIQTFRRLREALSALSELEGGGE